MSNDWLQDLEEKVHAASAALRALREENDELRAQVKDLEGRVDELQAAAENLAGSAADAGGEGDEGWQREREDIRGRVEKLADHLARLLGEA